ncbi:hypothetical protein CCP3SC1_460026 [Gammaproteobacteria bacterium]
MDSHPPSGRQGGNKTTTLALLPILVGNAGQRVVGEARDSKGQATEVQAGCNQHHHLSAHLKASVKQSKRMILNEVFKICD